MKYKELIEGLDELSFLSARLTSNFHCDYNSYYVTGTYYLINVHKISEVDVRKEFVSMNNIHHSVSFEEMFDDLPEEIKEKIIFHLDLFR